MTTPTLLELALRVEAGTAEEQASLLIKAFDATDWRSKRRGSLISHNPRWFRFGKMIHAEAFESAALMLEPEGYGICIRRFCDGTGNATVYAPETSSPPSVAATPALALASASLRAHAALESPQ